MARLAFIIFWISTLIAGQQLVAIRHRLSLGDSDLITRIFGETRVLMSARMIQKGDIYFHGGVEAEDDCEGMHGHPHHHTDGCDGHDSEHEPAHDGGQKKRDTDHGNDYAGAGWYRKIMQEVRPTSHIHLSSTREVKEILPWIRLATDLDPHNIEGYDVGAYWLTKMVKAPEKGLELVNEGIARNPLSFKLELTKGELLMGTDPVAADTALANAERKWIAQLKRIRKGDKIPANLTEPRPIFMERIQVFRARCMLNLGRKKQAVAFYERALKVSEHKESLRERIRELRSQTDGDPEQVIQP